MTIEQALEILIEYQKWRRGANMPQPYVGVVGEALDVAIECLKKKCKK